MTSRQIEYFLAVTKYKSFSLAAQNLYVSQPAVSQQLVVLESEIGFPLFVREHHNVELTDYGHIFYDACTKMQYVFTAAKEKMAELADSVKQHLTIGILEGITIPWLNDVIQAFSAPYADETVTIESHSFSGLKSGVESGTLDLIVTILVETDNPSIAVKKLCDAPCIFVISRNHPLAHETMINIGDFDGGIFYQIAKKELPTAADVMNKICTHYDIYPKRIINVPNPSSMLLMLTSGVGVAVLDKYSYPDILHFNSLRTIDTDLCHDVNIMWNTENENPLLGAFLEYAAERSSPAISPK